MSQEIFQDLFQKEFVPKVKSHLPLVRSPQKATLLMDNAHTHLILNRRVVKENNIIFASKHNSTYPSYGPENS